MRRLWFVLACLAAVPGGAATYETSAGPVSITPVVEDLEEPWAFAFLPGGGFLITERDGRLWHIAGSGTRTAVEGVPEVVAEGQGGLLDVVLAKDFAASREVFLTYAKPQGQGSGTALARAVLSSDGTRLENVSVLWEMGAETDGGRHFGSRVVEGADGALYVTVGDRGVRARAQDVSLANGSVVRVSRDGALPGSNPFAGQVGDAPAIWSYGHRNPQGATLDGQGRLWVVEHGARGGDEINLVKKGANFGWPVISFGRHYSGARIGEGTSKPGMEQPAHYWDPSIAPSGMAFYGETAFADWQGSFFVGSLKFDMISRLTASGRESLTEVERIATPETERVRDIRTGPNGGIWFLSVGNGTLYQMQPDG